MGPYPPSPRAAARATDFPWLPAPRSLVQALAVLAGVFTGAAVGAGAWLPAGLGAVALAGAAVATLRLRTLGRELNEARRARADWERRYQGLYASVAAGVLVAAPDGRLRSANRALVQLLGYDSEAALAAADFGQQAYVGPGTFEAVLRRVRLQGALEDFEVRLRRFDGLTVTALATIQAVWDEAGEVTAFEASILDITSLRLAESQRRSMERRYRRLFDSNAVGMLCGSLRRGTLEEANQRLLGLLGLRPSELPLPLERLIPEDQRAVNRNVRAALEMHGSAEPVASEYLHRDGSRVPVLLSAAMVEPQHGEFVAVVIDRSAEVVAAQRALAIRAFYDEMLDAVPTPLASFDREQRFTYCNRAFCDWLAVPGRPLGATLGELVGAARSRDVAGAAAQALGGASVRVPVGDRAGQQLGLAPRRDASGAIVGLYAWIGDPAPRAELPAAPAAGPAGAAGDEGDCAGGRRTA